MHWHSIVLFTFQIFRDSLNSAKFHKKMARYFQFKRKSQVGWINKMLILRSCEARRVDIDGEMLFRKGLQYFLKQTCKWQKVVMKVLKTVPSSALSRSCQHKLFSFVFFSFQYPEKENNHFQLNVGGKENYTFV